MKNLVFFVFFAFTITPSFLFSQSIEWLYSYSTNIDQVVIDSAIDTENNVVLLINSGQGGAGATIKKINSSGIELWSKELSVTRAVSIDTDSNNNIFILGSSSGTDLNPDPLEVNSFSTITNYSGYDNRALFILKLNNLGEFIDFSTIGEYPGCSDQCTFYAFPHQIKIDSNDNVVFSYSPLSGGFIDIDPSENIEYPEGSGKEIIKWSNDLKNLIWAKKISWIERDFDLIGKYDKTMKVMSFDFDSSDNIILASTDIIQNKGNIGLFKISSDGNFLNTSHETRIISDDWISIGDLCVNSENEIILGGGFITKVNLNPFRDSQEHVISSQNNLSCDSNLNYNSNFLVKYNSDFNVIWKKEIDSYGIDSIEDIEYLNEKIYVLGLSEPFSSYTNNCFKVWHQNFNSYLRVYNTTGELTKNVSYISPYPESPLNIDRFSIHRPTFNENHGPYWVTADWSNRNILLKPDGSFLIVGEYSSRSFEMGTWNLYTDYGNLKDGYDGGFDWDYCSIDFEFKFDPVLGCYCVPWSHDSSNSDYTIDLDNILKPYVAYYESENCNLMNNNKNNNNLSFYPNPTTSIVTIEGGAVYKIEVFSLQGRKLMTHKGNSIDLSELSNAMYIIKATNTANMQQQIYKVIKE